MINPNQIPSTGRKPLFVVKQLGFDSVPEFAASLPRNALVMDIGAGYSRLGSEVARMRPDTYWINADPLYADRKVAKKLTRDSPPNLEFLIMNIADQPDQAPKFKKGADLVISYWLMPHLSLETDTVARTAAKNMLSLLNKDGRLVVGPVRKPGKLNLFRYKSAVVYEKQDIDDQTIDEIIAKTKLWWLPCAIQRFSNRHNIHIGKRFVGGK